MLLLGIEADTADLAPVSEVNAERSPIGEVEAHPTEIRRLSRNEPNHTRLRDSTEPPVNDRNASPSGFHRPGPNDSVPLSAGYSLHIQQSLPKFAQFASLPFSSCVQSVEAHNVILAPILTAILQAVGWLASPIQ